MYRLNYRTTFDAAHQLKNSYNKKCHRLHGHTWQILFEIDYNEPLVKGMVIDFSVLKQMTEELDHQFINKKVSFEPTAENLAKYYYDKVKWYFFNQKNKERDIEIKITIWESEKSSITYYE